MNSFERRLAAVEEIRIPTAPRIRICVPPAELTEAEQDAWCDAKIAAEPDGGKGVRHIRIMFVRSSVPRHDERCS